MFACRRYTPAPHCMTPIGKSGAQRSSNPSTIQPSACYLRRFSFSCKQGVYIVLDQVCCNYRTFAQGLDPTYLYRLRTSKVLVSEPLFFPVTPNDGSSPINGLLLCTQLAIAAHCHTQSYCSCVPPPPQSLPLAYLPPPCLALSSTPQASRVTSISHYRLCSPGYVRFLLSVVGRIQIKKHERVPVYELGARHHLLTRLT
jgi:hypothetical protein